MIFYHGTPFKNWESIQIEGLKPAPLPDFVAEFSGKKEGVYVGVKAIVDGFVEGYLADESGETKFVILSVDILDTDKLIPDPQMKDPDFPDLYEAYVYPGRIPPDRIRLEEVADLTEELGETYQVCQEQ